MWFSTVGVIKMKNMTMYIVLVIAVILLTGCKKDNSETNFIPKQPLEFTDDESDILDDIIIDDITEPSSAPEDKQDEPVVTGETTTKYVKLSSYGAILNIRSAPSTEEDNVVGFLVHTEAVEVISIEDGWASILYNDEICYVSEDFLVDFVPPYISPPSPSQ